MQYGNKIQETIDFTINSQNELIVLTRGKDFSELFYVNNENSLQTNGNNVLLLKINGQSGNLIDYKGIGVGINPYHYSLDIDNHSVVTDTNDNILLSGSGSIFNEASLPYSTISDNYPGKEGTTIDVYLIPA